MSHSLYVFKVTLPTLMEDGTPNSFPQARDIVNDACEEAGDDNNWFTILEVHDTTAGAAMSFRPHLEEEEEVPLEYHDEEHWERFALELVVFDLLAAAPRDAGGISAYFTPDEHLQRVRVATDNVRGDFQAFREMAVDIGKAILSEADTLDSLVGYRLGKVAKHLSLSRDDFPWCASVYEGAFYDYRVFKLDHSWQRRTDSGISTFYVTVDIHT